MFKIESYVTPILLSYVDKYVRDFKPADAQVSLWAGGVALHNLVLKPDVLQNEVSLPFTLLSGRIHELLIQVPWTKIMSEPIVVTIDTIECVLSFNPPAQNEDAPVPIPKPQTVEAPPGYMQALVRRIVSNISLKVHHLIVKYVQDDIVLSLNVKHMSIDSTGANWEPSFADIDQHNPVLRRLVHLDDLTLCLDNSDSDGKIRFYQEPVLYRCQLDLRVLTSLVSANSRVAGGLSLQLRSSKLAWSVTNEQLHLLVRLIKERPTFQRPTVSIPKAQPQPLLNTGLVDISEPTRGDSWSEWAWSWLPSWSTESSDMEVPLPSNAIPVSFTAFLDDISVVFKILDIDGGTRKRFRPTLEFSASFAALKLFICSPTTLRASAGMRTLILKAIGKCVCGHVNINTAKDEPTTYCTRLRESDEEDTFEWTKEILNDIRIETTASLDSIAQTVRNNVNMETNLNNETPENQEHKMNAMFENLDPVVFIDFTHERIPPNSDINPFDAPPRDFQYSDWIEDCSMHVIVLPLQFRLCTGLYHRLMNVYSICKDIIPVSDTDVTMRTLTVEDRDALLENLPQRRIHLNLNGFRFRLYPWDHYASEKTINNLLCLDLETSKGEIVITSPLYPLRVCSAACQMPEDSSLLWKGARVHVTGSFTSIEAKISTSNNAKSKLCARADVQFVTHVLLNSQFFSSIETVHYSYSIKIKELNISGSAARLQAAYNICIAMVTAKPSPHFRHTSLFNDAVEDEELVALDMTFEELRLRGYITIMLNTHIITLDSTRATVIHSPEKGITKQAWLFSAPDIPSSTSYLRAAFQWCKEPFPNSLDYLGIWTEPIAVCIDPLFIAWLAYKPRVSAMTNPVTSVQNIKTVRSTTFFMKRRATPSSSSGRGGSRSGSGTELVHMRARSTESYSEQSEKKEKSPKDNTKEARRKDFLFNSDYLLKLHERFRHVLITVEFGLVLVYFSIATASAVDCPTVRQAMEKHTLSGQSVLCVSVGRWHMHSSTSTRHIWQEVKHNGPTVLDAPNKAESFPWKLQLADVSFYILEVRPASDFQGRENISGLRSQLKASHTIQPRTILELVTTVVTLSVLIKARQYKTFLGTPDVKSKSHEPEIDMRLRYFASGSDFKPTSLREFVRGPIRTKKSQTAETNRQPPPSPEPQVTQKITTGPIISVGVDLHADTPPVILRLDSDQVHLFAAAIHCITHIISLSKSPTFVAPRDSSSQIGIKSGQIDEDLTSSEEDTESQPEQLKSIFEPHNKEVSNVTSFFWFQWVISRVTIVVISEDIKFVFDVEDVISSIDIQEEYNQLKIKIGTASLKQFNKSDANEWVVGVFNGRVIEAREPANVNEETRFMNVTITQAQLSCLPENWKEQLNSKLFDKSQVIDTIWEIYLELAPLEVLLEPTIVEHLVGLANELIWKSDCPLQTQKEIIKRKTAFEWPFCYVIAGGIRVVIPSKHENQSDDTIMIMLGRVSVNPHPDNPMCRRPIVTSLDSVQSTSGNLEGRQYEIMMKNFTIRCVRFSQLVYHESSDHGIANVTGENPALKWSKPLRFPNITAIIHSMDISCLLAPSYYMGNTLTCGPGIELNFISDCTIDITLCQIKLLQNISSDIKKALCELNISINTNKCPYSKVLTSRSVLTDDDNFHNVSVTDIDLNKTPAELNPSVAGDSGVDISLSRKKNVSIAFLEQSTDPADYLELYITMGSVDISLQTLYNNSMVIADLCQPSKPEADEISKADPTNVSIKTVFDVTKPNTSKPTKIQTTRHRSVTEEARQPDMANIDLQNINLNQEDRRLPIKPLVKLMHFTLQQPNLYYWIKKTQRTFQASLFNISVSLGSGLNTTDWHQVLMSTEVGNLDPITEIPPALATLKFTLPGSGTTSYSTIGTTGRGLIQIDLERPLLLEIDTDRLKRLKQIVKMVERFIPLKKKSDSTELPLLIKLRRYMLQNGVDSAVIQTSQIGVTGFGGSAGWDSASVQVAWGSRPDRLVTRVLICSLLVAAGSSDEMRRCIIHPLQMGVDIDATWEAWRRVEGGAASTEPTVHIGIDLDRVMVDLRPSDLLTVIDIQNAVKELSEDLVEPSTCRPESVTHELPTSTAKLQALDTADYNVESDHYYKDDLRSGAFKIIKGSQLPMAYQVVLSEYTVSWMYPHPRAITRLIAFPLPGQNKELECVLELYNKSTCRWEPHTYFDLPVNDPMEICMNTQPPDAVFATTWRFRTNETPKSAYIYEFNMNKFLPRQDPLATESQVDEEAENFGGTGEVTSEVTAEELSGVLRVDSYFASRLLPRLKICLQMSLLQAHIHNTLPRFDSKSTNLRGYYISKPQLLAHRVVTLSMSQNELYAELQSMAGLLYLAKTKISGSILDCETGTLEDLFDDVTIQAGVSVPNGKFSKSSVRLHTSSIVMGLQLSHIRTIQSLISDWQYTLEKKTIESEEIEKETAFLDEIKNMREMTMETVTGLQGRVTLWLHNCCLNGLRISQEGTNEMIVLDSGARLAYRWCDPSVTKKIRFALSNTLSEWRWSNSVPFVKGHYRALLEDTALMNLNDTTSSMYVHVNVVQRGSTLGMHLSGRLTIANLLRYGLYYKVRSKKEDNVNWNTISAGEIGPECLGRSVICDANTDMMLKIKLANKDAGWSGDIPLKECPKENVPWLVKVPSQGDIPFISVWCRVIKARSDGCILAMIWPLYVLRSHLPLDTDVLIVSDLNASNINLDQAENPPPLIQCAPGRGFSTHLLTPGTTSARHTLSFQYRNVECPVTRETIPLHYGVTDTSVFDKRSPVNQIHDVIEEMRLWIEQSGRTAKLTWPYSIVAKHWPGLWQPALLQPRCDVRVRYQAVKAGGGCSLEIHLSPMVLMCNASPVGLTLRAYDAAPLCKLDSGTAIAPATTILTKPFFLSIEKERETFVSGQLEISDDIPGRYGVPQPGKVTFDHPTNFAIQCNQRVAMFSMYYEIKDEISILGVISTFTIINQLNIDLLVSAIAVPTGQVKSEAFNPKYYKLLHPTPRESIHGLAVCRFWLNERWRGTDASNLLTFFCFALRDDDENKLVPLQAPVPVRIGVDGLNRRAIALIDVEKKSVPLVVTQQKYEGRWLITIAADPCPQYLIQNSTHLSIAIGEPNMTLDNEPKFSYEKINTIPESPGAKWGPVVGPAGILHYSSPSYNANFPAAPETRILNSFLTFSTVEESKAPVWCTPVSVTEGEQLVQLDHGNIIKIRIKLHPHSTSIKLLSINQSDLSASDIRRRIASPSVTSNISITKHEVESISTSSHLEKVQTSHLERAQTDDKLVLKSKSALAALALKSQGKDYGLEIYSATSLATINTSAISKKSKVDENRGITETSELTKKEVKHADEIEEHGSSIGSCNELLSEVTIAGPNVLPSDSTKRTQDMLDGDLQFSERFRCIITSLSIELTTSVDSLPLFALNLNRAAFLLLSQASKTKLISSILDLQIDNLQYESGQYDFSVIASTNAGSSRSTCKPTLWSLFAEQEAFCTSTKDCNLVINTCFDRWEVACYKYRELTEVDIQIGSLALYIEDAYVKALVDMFRVVFPATKSSDASIALAEAHSLQQPVRLRMLVIHPLDLTLTLHTAVRMYIALDQSPLHLSAFEMQNLMTSKERLVHALTVHYLSAAILGAGWVVGGLELLGAPGALAARVGGASGGVRGFASATAAALVRSLSAWAGSLARNLDLLAGDEEHSRRAAAARRRAPDSLIAGLTAGLANFAINILGAVGGLAHHPVVGVATGESAGGALALRRGLVGALAKPLSATADLLAYAGHGLLRQTGWDPTPQPWLSWRQRERASSGWLRDCVRWQFKLAEVDVIDGFEVLLNNAHIILLLTHKYIVVASPSTEQVIEMIDLRFCTLRPYRGSIIEVSVSQGRVNRSESRALDEDDEFRQANSAAMARVARYTGAEAGSEAGAGAGAGVGAGAGAGTDGEMRVLSMLPAPGHSYALHAALAALIAHNSSTHFSLL